jgi:hypothetical protein
MNGSHIEQSTLVQGTNSLASILNYGLVDRDEPSYNASLPIVHVVRAGGSNSFPSSYSESNWCGGCKCFSSYMAYWIELTLCAMLHCYL